MQKPAIIGFSNHKGGVAKTTSCASMAYGISAFFGLRVLCVDMDPQGHLTKSLGVSIPIDTTKEFLEGKNVLPHPVAERLHIIPSTLDLAVAELGYIGRPDWQFLLQNALRKHTEYDIVLLDCPPTLSILTTNVLTASKWLIVPILCEGFAIEGLAQILQTIRLVKNSVNPTLEILGVLPTRYDARKRVNREVVELLPTLQGGYFAGKVMDPIPDNVSITEAGPMGKSIYEYRGDSQGARAYSKACGWVVGHLGFENVNLAPLEAAHGK